MPTVGDLALQCAAQVRRINDKRIAPVQAAKTQPNMTLPIAERPAQRRNKGFDDTHLQMIETAVRLISEKGVDSLSMAAIARAMAINRTTVYYHFESREALLDAVKHWSSEQLAKGLSLEVPQQERIDFITRFVLENPELITLWIDEFISVGDIRSRYPFWDTLVKGIATRFAEKLPGETVDPEVYCIILLSSAIVGPRVFKNSVDPSADIDTIVKRFRSEQQRLLRHDALLK
jgi:AcrR family transcriptional regulator